MLKLNTILAPVDFCAPLETEAQNAADIARKFGSRLILLPVIPRFAEAHPTDPAAAEIYAHEFTAEVERGVNEALKALAWDDSRRKSGSGDYPIFAGERLRLDDLVLSWTPQT